MLGCTSGCWLSCKGLLLCLGQCLRPLLQPRGGLNLPCCHPPVLSSAMLGCFLSPLPFAWRQDGVGGLWHGEKATPEQDLLGKILLLLPCGAGVPSGAPQGERAMEDPDLPMAAGAVPGQGLSGKKTHPAMSRLVPVPSAAT